MRFFSRCFQCYSSIPLDLGSRLNGLHPPKVACHFIRTMHSGFRSANSPRKWSITDANRRTNGAGTQTFLGINGKSYAISAGQADGCVRALKLSPRIKSENDDDSRSATASGPTLTVFTETLVDRPLSPFRRG